MGDQQEAEATSLSDAERSIREKVATEIEAADTATETAFAVPGFEDWYDGFNAGVRHCADIARSGLNEARMTSSSGVGGAPVTGQEADEWNAVYDVLVEHCGATEDDRSSFVALQSLPQHPTEYRFIGSLGFGGKFWREPPGYVGERWRVSCYREDETPERRAAIDAANDALIDLITDRSEARRG